MAMRTSNPVLRENTFREIPMVGAAEHVMTLQGVAGKTAILLGLAAVSAGFVWNRFLTAGDAAIYPWMIGGLIGGLVMALVCCFKQTAAPYVAPVYALLEGLFLGAVSALFNAAYPGVVITAVGLTFGTLASLLLLYAAGTIRATENFKLGVVAATGGILLFYLASWVMRLFGATMPFLHDAGPIGIGISLVIVVIAALNLVLDFDFIEKGVEARAPKYMEWYAAFGLMVTLVWLYLEILRLLGKLRK
jgi:uncharacterized YccA/Bax inhibitor family protein